MSDLKGNKVRVGFTVKPEIRDYINEQCEFYGMSIGSYLSMVLIQQKEQRESVRAMQNVQELIDQLNLLSENRSDIE